MKKTLIILTLTALTLLAASCKTKEVPGRVRAPRHCNTCTKWSYVPKVEGIDTLVLPPMSYRPTKEGAYLWAEELGMTCLQN